MLTFDKLNYFLDCNVDLQILETKNRVHAYRAFWRDFQMQSYARFAERVPAVQADRLAKNILANDALKFVLFAHVYKSKVNTY